MSTEEYPIGYDDGRRDGYNEAMNEKPAREWVGLTDEQIKIIWRDIDASEGLLIRFARAIEAKLREKNGG